MARRSRGDTEIDLAALAELVGGELHGGPTQCVRGVAELEDATESDAAFCVGRGKLEALLCTRAGVVLVPPGLQPELEATGRATIRVEDPYRAVVYLLEHLYPLQRQPQGVHPSAAVGEGVVLGAGVSIGAQAVIGAGARIGARSEIGPGCVVALQTVIGEDCVLYPNVTLYDGTTLGDRVVLHAGTVLGADGFGFARDGSVQVRMPQVGGVLIEDDVEIGANSCVDRGTLRRTRIGRGTKIDNLVQIGHNCDIGEHCALSGLVGLSGSTVLEDGVILGGNVGSAGHLVVGKGAMVAAKSGLHRDVAAGSVGGGMPYLDIRVWRRVVGSLPKLPGLLRRVRRLEAANDGGKKE